MGITGTLKMDDLFVILNLAIKEVKLNEKGGGIRIEIVNAGINSKKGIENINTVKFSIPVAFLK